MAMNLIISDLNFNSENFLYHKTNEKEETRLKQLFPEFEGFYDEKISKVLCYSISKKNKDDNPIVFSLSNITRGKGTIKIYLNKEEEIGIDCENVNKNIYSIQCRKGLRGEKSLYIFPLDDDDFEDVCFPESKYQRCSNIIKKLDEYRSKSNWLDMINVVGDFSRFSIDYKDFWNNAQLLDRYLVYPLSHLVTAGDKYKVKEKTLPLFKKCIERVLELYPDKLDTLTVYAYFYYCNYMDIKLGHLQDDFDNAKLYYDRILSINPNHIQSLYRVAKLKQIYLENNQFSHNKETKEYPKEIVDSYKTIIDKIEESPENKTDKNKYEYVSSIFNLLKFEQNMFLNYERAYFSKKIYNQDISQMLTREKASQLKETLDLGNKLMDMYNISLETPTKEMLNKTKKNQIDIFYRVAIVYQYMAFYCDLIGRHDDLIKYCEISNRYIAKAFDLYHFREKKGIRSMMPKYLYKIKATNMFFLGEQDKALELLSKGKSDSWYRAAELLCLENNFDKAKEYLIKIQPNDKLNMFNKAEKLLQKIKYV